MIIKRRLGKEFMEQIIGADNEAVGFTLTNLFE